MAVFKKITKYSEHSSYPSSRVAELGGVEPDPDPEPGKINRISSLIQYN